MPIQITCPRCQAAYPVDDDLKGRNVRCRGCDLLIRVEEPIADGGGPLEIVQPLGRSWRTVYSGLGLIKWGIVAALAALACNALVVLILLAMPNHPDRSAGWSPEARGRSSDRGFHARNQPDRSNGWSASADEADPLAGACLLAIAVLSILSVLLGLLGRFLCCSVPAATEARQPAIVSLFWTLLALLGGGYLGLEMMLLPPQTAPPGWWLPVAFVVSLGALVAEVLFLVFLSNVGHFLQEPAVGRRILLLVLGTAGLVVALVGTFLFAANRATPMTGRGSPPPTGAPAAQSLTEVVLAAELFSLVGSAIVLLLYLGLINVTRRALARRLAGEAAPRPATA